MTKSNIDTPILDDDAVGEIEARLSRCVELDSLADVRALSQTVRALRTWNQQGCLRIADLLSERASLQSQLEQVTKERDDANKRASEAQKSVEDLSRVIFNSEQATSMRSACVEKVRPILRDYELEFRRKTNSATNIVDYVVMALESVSIQEQK